MPLAKFREDFFELKASRLSRTKTRVLKMDARRLQSTLPRLKILSCRLVKLWISASPASGGEKICIRLIDGHTAAITAGSVPQVLHYSQMGLEIRQNGMPAVQWE